MIKEPRLFDYSCVAQALEERARLYPREIAVEKPLSLGADWQKITAKELFEQVVVIGCGWIGLGLEPGERVAIMGSTSYDWVTLDLGAQAAGLVSVPIYETDSPEQIAWILKDSNSRAVICDNSAQARVVKTLIREEGLAGQVKRVFSLDDSGLELLLEHGRAISALEVKSRLRAIEREQLATIVYTSGTTGRPKGVEITHANLLTPMQSVAEGPWKHWIWESEARVLLFLPVAHVLCRFISYQMLVGHGTVGYVPSVKNLLRDLESFRPKALLVVPRVLEKIYNAADAKAGSGVKLKIFRWAAHVAVEYGRKMQEGQTPSHGHRFKLRLARALVLSKIQQLLGGNMQGFVSGGAPLSPRLGFFFKGCGIDVLEGYGETETTGPVTMSRLDNNLTGSVGLPLSCNEIRISPEGEVQVRGASVMRGYHNDPEGTRQAFTADGWLKTGDMGRIDEVGRLHITGRMKEIIVTAGGKNVSPTVLEETLKGHPLISQVMVVGDNRPFVGALVTLDKEMLPLWLQNHSLPPMDVTRAAREPKVLASISRAVERTNKQVSRAESIRKIKLLTTDWTVANGLLTPSLKIKRALIAKRYSAEIEQIYAPEAKE